MADSLPWTEEQTSALASAIIGGDADSVAAWLNEHITSEEREYALIGGLALWCAVVGRVVMPVDEGGMYGMHVEGDATRHPVVYGAMQMVCAALNDDEDALFGHVDALFANHDEDFRVRVVLHLMATFRHLSMGLGGESS